MGLKVRSSPPPNIFCSTNANKISLKAAGAELSTNSNDFIRKIPLLQCRTLTIFRCLEVVLGGVGDVLDGLGLILDVLRWL